MSKPTILTQLEGNSIASRLNKYKGKYISILGDSISTYIGYIPAGAIPYYNDPATMTVDQTWWKRLIDQTGMNLCINNSYSQSRITNTGDSPSPAVSSGRTTALHTAEHDPDVIVIYMGINDFSGDVPIGTYDGTQAFPTDQTTFREAYAIVLRDIMVRYPQAEIYCCTLPNSTTTFPQVNGGGIILQAYNKAIRDIADLFGAKIIEFSKAYSHQMTTLTAGLHPNALGHYRLSCVAIKTIEPTAKFSPTV